MAPERAHGAKEVELSRAHILIGAASRSWAGSPQPLLILQRGTGRRRIQPLCLGSLICLCCLANPAGLFAGGWPKLPKWLQKGPDTVTARCTLDRDQIQFGSAVVLRAKADAADSRDHPLAYVWSGNGGKISGVGPEVEVETSGLNPGVYRVEAVAQDAHKNSARCTADFRVLLPPDSVALSCSAAPSVVEQGKPATLDAQGTDALGHPLRYYWFTNGGALRGEGPQVSLDTSGLPPGVYTITGRVEDGQGGASDCAATVKVTIPPPPPIPPQPANIAEIVFSRNRDTLEANARAQLQKVLSRLHAEPKARVSIEAYAGPDESDPGKLAAARAESVKRYLLENGAAETQVRMLVGLGGRRGGLRNRTLDIIWLPDGLEY